MGVGEAGSRRAGERLRVVVADAAPGARLTLAVTLQSFDPTIEIVEAQDGREAAEKLARIRPDLAFVNVHMAGMTGAEAVAVARHQGARPLTFLMSDAVVKKWVDLSIELDAYEFLKKPFDATHVASLLVNVRRMREPLRLLLVEENEAARALVRKVLGASRFSIEIDETDAGRHALKLLQLTAYDLALIDAGLTGVDGLETACQAREVAPDTRLVLMTASPTDSLPGAMKHFGLSGFLKKPFYVRDVEKLLHKTYGLRRPYLMNALTPEHDRKARSALVAAAGR